MSLTRQTTGGRHGNAEPLLAADPWAGQASWAHVQVGAASNSDVRPTVRPSVSAVANMHNPRIESATAAVPALFRLRTGHRSGRTRRTARRATTHQRQCDGS